MNRMKTAFPVNFDGPFRSSSDYVGMTIRDYFAAHAPDPIHPMQLIDHCAYRYRYADAMIAVREETSSAPKEATK